MKYKDSIIESNIMDFEDFLKLFIDNDSFEKAMERFKKLSDPTKLTEMEKQSIVNERKKLLNLSEGLYTTDGFVPREANQKELKEVREFEKRTGAKVYHVSESLGGNYLMLFFIPATKGELQAQLNTMENCGKDWQYAYVINKEIPQYSECGPVHVMCLHNVLACVDYS